MIWGLWVTMEFYCLSVTSASKFQIRILLIFFFYRMVLGAEILSLQKHRVIDFFKNVQYFC